MTEPGSGPATSIRPSEDDDVAAIAAIYSHHVRHGFGSFEIEPPGKAEMARRRAELLARGMPHLVAVIGGEVVGYAYAGPYRPRPAYRATVECSVYVHPDRVGQGIGRLLLKALLPACEARGFRQIVAAIGDSGNRASIGLHARFGFEEVGVLRSVGFKHGRWLDVVLMQRALGEGDTTPPA